MDTQILLIIGGVIVLIALVVYWQRQGVVKRPSHRGESGLPDWLPQGVQEAPSPEGELPEWLRQRPSTPQQSEGELPEWLQTLSATDGMSGLNEQQMAQIYAEIQAKRKINAIKLYREFTGLGLKEAKDAVDAIMSGKTPYHEVERPYNLGDGDMMDKIQRELQAGRKINAIKLYREMTGLGLKEAKDAIDAMEKGQMPTPSVAPPQMSGDAMGQVEQELRAGRKINAVKLYREAYGVGLKEAKDAVDALERQLGL